MKSITCEWVGKEEDDWKAVGKLARGTDRLPDQICFHCQQATEEYLKALLQENGATVPKTHNLNDLLNRVLAFDATLKGLRRGLKSLTRYAVEYRYPGIRASKREMVSALRVAERVRAEIRTRLGLPT